MRDRYRFISEPADRLYLLLRFARRCVEASLQDVPEPTLHHGLRALCVVDQQRVDFRDAIVAAELIAWAMNREGLGYVEAFERAAEPAEPGMAATLRRLAHRSSAQLSPGMWRVVATPSGPALVETFFDRWEPTVDLVALAFEIADLIEADVYRNPTLSVAHSLPQVWLGLGGDDRAVELARTETRAVLSVSAKVDPAISPTSDSKMFVIWVAEAQSSQDASLLATAAKPGQSHERVRGRIRECGVRSCRPFSRGRGREPRTQRLTPTPRGSRVRRT